MSCKRLSLLILKYGEKAKIVEVITKEREGENG